MDPIHSVHSLADLTAASKASMTERCRVQRHPTTVESGVTPTDEMGNPVPEAIEDVDMAPGEAGVRTRCRIAGGPRTEQERAIAGQLANPDLVIVAFPKGTTVLKGDRVYLYEREPALSLEVVWVPDPLPTNHIDVRVMAQREQ